MVYGFWFRVIRNILRFRKPLTINYKLKTINQFVRMEGLEPPHLTASDPKSDVSTNFTTSGRNVQCYINFKH
jgi:hypothetical protein